MQYNTYRTNTSEKVANNTGNSFSNTHLTTQLGRIKIYLWSIYYNSNMCSTKVYCNY